jgi:pimeloyl-ACP methyl ester carboxylesterase
MEVFADLVRAVLDHEQIRHCCMIGHSMGGYVTLAFAEAYPACLAGFGLFHSTAFPDNADKQQARLRGISFMRENGAAPFLRQSIPNLFTDQFKQEHPEEVSALVQRGASFEHQALIAYYEAMLKRPDRTAVLASGEVPVLIIAGALDNAVPLRESVAQAALAKTTVFHTLEGAAHMGMWEAAAAANLHLSEYLSFVFGHSNHHQQ